jgi:hypothetical protein
MRYSTLGKRNDHAFSNRMVRLLPNSGLSDICDNCSITRYKKGETSKAILEFTFFSINFKEKFSVRHFIFANVFLQSY